MGAGHRTGGGDLAVRHVAAAGIPVLSVLSAPFARANVEQGTQAALANRAGGVYRGLFERQATEFAAISAAE